MTHNFEAGKVSLRRVEDVQPAFTEMEFNEALEAQRKDDINMNKLHLSISDQRIANTSDSKDIIVGIVDSTERKPKRAALRKDNELGSGNEDDDDGDNSGGEGQDLFSGLLGNGDEDLLER